MVTKKNAAKPKRKSVIAKSSKSKSTKAKVAKSKSDG